MVFRINFKKKMFIGFAILIGCFLSFILISFISENYFISKDLTHRIMYREPYVFQYLKVLCLILSIGGVLIIGNSLLFAFLNESIKMGVKNISIFRFDKLYVSYDSTIDKEIFGYKPFKKQNPNSRSYFPPIRQFVFYGREGLYITDFKKKIRSYLAVYDKDFSAAVKKAGFIFPTISIYRANNILLIYEDPKFFKFEKKSLIEVDERDYDIEIGSNLGGYIKKNNNSEIQIINPYNNKEHFYFRIEEFLEGVVVLNSTRFSIDLF